MKTLNQLIKKMIHDQKNDQLKDLETYRKECITVLDHDQEIVLKDKYDILKDIDHAEMDLFMLRMKDKWNNSDYLLFDQLNLRIKELKEML